jgi:undecaprenyl-diphosphatase
LVVAFAFVIGGVILLFVDEWFNKPTIDDEKDITYLTALKIGFFQCLAMVPGVSRSGASIVGGMTQKLSRKAAAEFSFFLAVPTMFGATLKDLYDFYKHGNMTAADIQQDVKFLLIGSAVAFVVALLAIKSFITFLEQKGFKLFGIYRIIAGIVIIVLYYTGNALHTV